jgi:hypothetical protein
MVVAVAVGSAGAAGRVAEGSTVGAGCGVDVSGATVGASVGAGDGSMSDTICGVFGATVAVAWAIGFVCGWLPALSKSALLIPKVRTSSAPRSKTTGGTTRDDIVLCYARHHQPP